MNIVDRDSLYQILSCRHDAIVEKWCRALTRVGFATINISEMYRHLGLLVDQCISLVLDEQFDHAAAEAIGATLADWHFIQPEVLGQTQSMLQHAFIADLPAEYVVELMPNLTALIGAFGIGFTRRAQQVIVSEQEQILNALLLERTGVIEALRISEEWLRTIIVKLPIIVFSINREGVITLIEGCCLQKIGCESAKLLGQSIFKVALTRPDILANVRDALVGETFTAIVPMCGMVFETRYAPLRNQDGEVYALIGVAIDITERQRMEAALTQARYLISESREDERQRLARDLHDGVVQQLLGLSYQVVQAQQRAPNTTLPASQVIEEYTLVLKTIQQGIQDAVAQLRHSISELRPIGLDDLGLTTALETLVVQLEQEVGVELPMIELDLDWVGPDLSPSIAGCLFRVAQEALRNALRHAHANHITTILRIYEKTVMLCVVDDGIGFKMPSHITQFVRAQHFGLVGLLEQAECLYGTFRIWSEPGEGTEVTVELPLYRDLIVKTRQERVFPDALDTISGFPTVAYKMGQLEEAEMELLWRTT